MPNVNYENIKEYIHLLVSYSGSQLLTQEYRNYLASLADLSECMDKYYRLDENGEYPKLGAEGIEELRQAYEKVFAANKLYDDAYKALEGVDDMFLNDRQELVDDFNNLLGQDLAALSGGIGKDKSLQEILDNARGVSLDLSNQIISVSGENLSSRMPVSYVDDSGKEIKGFFTENSKLDRNAEFQAMYDKAIEGHPEFARAFEALLSDKWFNSCFAEISNIKNYLFEPLKTKTLSELVDEFLDQIEPVYPKGTDPAIVERGLKEFNEYRASITKDDTFALRFFDFAKTYTMIQNKYDVILNGAETEKDAVIEERNAAMSVVADMLGSPNLIARSVKMQITRNGETKEGVFMQFADGCDINSIKEDSPLNRINEESLNYSEAFDSIATLQVEDFICGNVDRHAGNMFYKFEEGENGPKFTGVVGIDNDCSFGKLPPTSKSGNMCMVGTDHMLVLGEKTANKILGISPDMLKVTLRNYKLSDNEIKAAVDRLKYMQKKIAAGKEYFKDHPEEKLRQGYIRIVKEGEWNNYSLDDLAYKTGYKEAEDFDKATLTHENYFTMVADLPNIVVSAKKEKEEKGKTQSEIEAKNPNLKAAAKVDVKMAQGVVMTDNNAAGINDNNKKLETLSARMDAVNKGFFISSPQFDEIIKAVKNVKKLSAESKPNMSSQKLEELKKAYEELSGKIDKYLAKKESEKKAKELKGKKPSKTAQKRTSFAEDLKKFTNERIDRLNASFNAKHHEEAIAANTVFNECKRLAEISKENLLGMENGTINANVTKEYLAAVVLKELWEAERKREPNSNNRILEKLVMEKGMGKVVNLLADNSKFIDKARELNSHEAIESFFANNGENEMAKGIRSARQEQRNKAETVKTKGNNEPKMLPV